MGYTCRMDDIRHIRCSESDAIKIIDEMADEPYKRIFGERSDDDRNLVLEQTAGDVVLLREAACSHHAIEHFRFLRGNTERDGGFAMPSLGIQKFL